MTLSIPAKESDDIQKGLIYVSSQKEYYQFFDKNGDRIYQDHDSQKSNSNEDGQSKSVKKSTKTVIESR